MGLKFSYTILAPIYDAIVAAPTEKIRQQSLQRLSNVQPGQVLLNGIGSGLDIPFLPDNHQYTGTDITPAMLSRAEQRAQDHALTISLQQADSMALPFDDESYDHVVMHLIMAVVPQPLKALQEASRVLKPGGKIFVLDKFLQPGQIAITRRILNPLIRHIATRTDVVFEDIHQQCETLKLIENKPVMLNGWFRSIELEKEN
jgi:ubiquinone/menaquinone biosynthesis C-methylase UbiE